MAKNLFNQQDVTEMQQRIKAVTMGSPRLWGKMSVNQMVAHLNKAMETARGFDKMPPVFFIGRMIGKMMRKGVLSEKNWGKGSPTDRSYIIKGDPDLEIEKAKLIASIQSFYEGGPAKCTTHPHPFFGNFTPEEWAFFQWKHLDHHLRQFNA